MFGWLKRKNASAPERSKKEPIAPTLPPAASPPGPGKAVAAEPAAARPASPSVTAGLADRHASPAGWTKIKGALPPRGYKDPVPAAGMIATEIAPPRVRTAIVTRVLADGRRVMASIGGTSRSCWYTRGKDGTYRLESAPGDKAARLVLGLDLTAGALVPRRRLSR